VTTAGVAAWSNGGHIKRFRLQPLCFFCTLQFGRFRLKRLAELCFRASDEFSDFGALVRTEGFNAGVEVASADFSPW